MGHQPDLYARLIIKSIYPNEICIPTLCYLVSSCILPLLLHEKVEASCNPLGVSIVKLMGKKSGCVGMQASLASGMVDICLIPEIRFQLEGPKGLLFFVDQVLRRQGHCVICISEGAGQEVLHTHHHRTQHLFQLSPEFKMNEPPGLTAPAVGDVSSNVITSETSGAVSAGTSLGEPITEPKQVQGEQKPKATKGVVQKRHIKIEAQRHAHHRAMVAAAAASAGMYLDAVGERPLRYIF